MAAGDIIVVSEDASGRKANNYDGTHAIARVAALELNLTMENDGITDSGLGADNGTLTGDAYYGGVVSSYSRVLAANVTGHAAEDMNTVLDGSVTRTIIKRGD